MKKEKLLKNVQIGSKQLIEKEHQHGTTWTSCLERQQSWQTKRGIYCFFP
jgi:hypothetical protein